MHYKSMPIQYTAIFHCCKNANFRMKMFDIFLISCSKHRLFEAVLTSTHNVCFRAKLRKITHTHKPLYYNIKVGERGYKSHGRVILVFLSCLEIESGTRLSLTILMSNNNQGFLKIRKHTPVYPYFTVKKLVSRS